MTTLFRRKGKYEIHRLPRPACPACGGKRVVIVARKPGTDEEIRSTVCANDCSWVEMVEAA